MADTYLDGAGPPNHPPRQRRSLFRVSTNVTFSVANLVLSCGRAVKGGGIKNHGGFVNVTNCVFSRNTASRGGAIWNSGTLVVDFCTFTANSAVGTNGVPGNWYGYSGGPGSDATGGAIYNLGAMTVNRSMFNSNSVVAGNGAGGYVGIHGDQAMPGGNGGNGGAGGIGQGGAILQRRGRAGEQLDFRLKFGDRRKWWHGRRRRPSIRMGQRRQWRKRWCGRCRSGCRV